MRRVRQSRAAMPAELDALVQDVLTRLVRVLAGCGYTPQQLLRGMRAESGAARPRRRKPSDAEIACFVAAPHVLTHWHTDPEFLNAMGHPRPLPLRGPGPSVESLAARVGCGPDAAALVEHLERYRGIRRQGRLFVPRGRALSYRGSPIGQHLHGLLVLQGMLRNVEHNVRAGRHAPTWFEFVAENSSIPAAAVRLVEREVRGRGMPFLNAMDLEMRQVERHRTPKQKTQHVAVGVYFYSDTPPKRRRQ